MGTPEEPITNRLGGISAADQQAAETLLPLVYGELRQLARRQLASQPPGQTLQPTALVHEAYLRLLVKSGDGLGGFDGTRHFFFAAARAMRDILIERARTKAGPKRGGGRQRVDLESLQLASEAPAEELLALDEAIERLGRYDSRKKELVSLRFYAGLSAQEAAAALGISLRTAEREWRFIRAKLRDELSPK